MPDAASPPRSWQPYSPHELAEITRLRGLCTPWKVIALALGRSPQYLQRVARRHGLQLASSRPRWSEAEIETLRQLTAAHKSAREIARELGRSIVAVRIYSRRLRRQQYAP